MRYLGLALFAEGPTDHAFLRPLLGRLCAQICAEEAEAPVEVGEVWELHTPRRLHGEPREVRILEAAREALELWNLLFIHSDGNGDPDAARRERIAPAVARIVGELQDDARRPLAVVPVHETEAWLLADGDALRAAFGTRKSDADLGLPARPRDVESLPDPKEALNASFLTARRGRASPHEKAAGQFALVGEQIRLDVLQRVPAFANLREDLIRRLRELRYVPMRDT